MRYNGGPQAAHHVVLADGRSHCFAQLGAGMLQPGTRTLLSPFMLVEPLALLREADRLTRLGVVEPLSRTTLSARSVVVTPFHKLLGRLRELSRGAERHGSCGLGVGQAFLDSQNPSLPSLRVEDLLDRARMQAENALRQNPQVMRDYLSNLFTPRPGQRASLDIESNSDYVTVASAFERLKTGETLDTSEQAQIRQILNSTDPENRGISEEISARYPQQAAQFITAGNSPSEPEVPAAASQASYSPSATRTQAMAI